MYTCCAVLSYLVMSDSEHHGLQPHQAPLSLGFSRQEYWSGLPCPPPEDLPKPGTEPRSPALQEDTLLPEPLGKPVYIHMVVSIYTDLCIYMLLLLLSHFSRVRLCATPQKAAQALPSLGFSRQEHWSGLPLPSPLCESKK